MGDEYPKLDSISFNIKHKYYHTTTTITKPLQTKKKVIQPSVQLGIGYGLTKHEFDTYIGVGISINL